MKKDNRQLSKSFIRALELQEKAYLGSHYIDAPANDVSNNGLAFREIADGGAAIAANTDLLGYNRVVGLGVQEPITADLLKKLVDLYDAAGASRFFLQLNPGAETQNARDLLSASGFYHYNNWTKMYRPVLPLPTAQTHLDIREIGKSEGRDFAELIVAGFDWSPNLIGLLANPVGKRGWKHYLAYDKSKPVACAALFVQEEMASMAFAATLPEYRGCGAQSALIAQRMKDAAAAGCKWAVVETAEEKPDKPVPSFRNMRRLGFEIAYQRPNYIYCFDSN